MAPSRAGEGTGRDGPIGHPAHLPPRGTPILVIINQVTDNPAAGVGVADLGGHLLDGNNDGFPGGVFMQAVIAGGPSVRPPTRHSSVEKGARLVHGPRARRSVKLPTGPVATSSHRWSK